MSVPCGQHLVSPQSLHHPRHDPHNIHSLPVPAHSPTHQQGQGQQAPSQGKIISVAVSKPEFINYSLTCYVTHQVAKYYSSWILSCKLNQSRILAFKKGGRPKRNKRWTAYDPTVKVANKINYLQVTFENKGGWNRQ
jgi:hypothetical protein